MSTLYQVSDRHHLFHVDSSEQLVQKTEQNGCQFADNIFELIFVNVFLFKFHWFFVPKVEINI